MSRPPLLPLNKARITTLVSVLTREFLHAGCSLLALSVSIGLVGEQVLDDMANAVE